MNINEDIISEYKAKGFLIVKGGIKIDPRHYRSRLEQAIEVQANSIGVTGEDYSRAVCRWDSPNEVVQEFVRELDSTAQPLASLLLERQAEIVRASVIRKHFWAGKPTHGHQDAGYWLKNASHAYDISSWIALEDVDETNGALRVIPGSHLAGAEPQQDFLAKDFQDPAKSWGDKALTLTMSAGDILLFSPFLWHASHPCGEGRTRTALVIRWMGNPPVYKRSDAPEVEKAGSKVFGMLTAGELLSDSLRLLLKNTASLPVPEKREELIRLILGSNLLNALPEPHHAESALKKLLILTLAQNTHYGNDLGASVWEEIRRFVVEPCAAMCEGNGGI